MFSGKPTDRHVIPKCYNVRKHFCRINTILLPLNRYFFSERSYMKLTGTYTINLRKGQWRKHKGAKAINHCSGREIFRGAKKFFMINCTIKKTEVATESGAIFWIARALKTHPTTLEKQWKKRKEKEFTISIPVILKGTYVCRKHFQTSSINKTPNKIDRLEHS